ncbi:MAG: hypothetical protein JST00_42800 [Deltaproteobacteria bacterium]|nr:hypothetical protein [Deltaproteobacteria bacterium]
MVKERFDISYAAHTASCTFLLDEEGICRRIVMVRHQDGRKRRDSGRTAARCVGAQYVASLDGSAAGGLVEMPRVGAAMLFARVDERGRVSLVRTGVVTGFEAKAAHDPFVDSASVETSAPDLRIPPAPEPSQRPAAPVDPDYFDASDRTQRLPAIRAEDLARAMTTEEHELATAEYKAADLDEPPLRPTIPSNIQAPTTLRHPPPAPVQDDDDDDEGYLTSARARGMLPRRDAYAGSAARARVPAPQSFPVPAPSDVVISRRKRG